MKKTWDLSGGIPDRSSPQGKGDWPEKAEAQEGRQCRGLLLGAKRLYWVSIHSLSFLWDLSKDSEHSTA